MAMTNAECKEDWLFTNALVAFVGALLMAQAWEPSEGTFKLLFFFDVPNYTGFIIFLIIAALFVLSVLLAVASAVPPLSNLAINLATPFSLSLDLVVWVAFIISWATSIPELPPDQWWSRFLLLGGLVLILFIPVRMFLRYTQTKNYRE